MRRREFIKALAGSAAAWPLTVSAQEAGRTYRLGFLLPVASTSPAIVTFFDELRANGFVEGQNLVVVPGGFEVRNEQIAEVVAALVRSAPDAILSGGDLSTRALLKASQTIPIVVITEDVVAAGFAASFARPGGNVTGVSLMSTDLDGKRQDILIEAVPEAHRIATLVDSNVATLQHLKDLEESAKARARELLIIRVANRNDLEPAIRNATSQGAKALNVLASPMLFLNRRTIIDRAVELRLPAIFQWPETAEDGGLLGYGPSFIDIFRQRATIVAKILRGTKPGDLPVEQPSTFKLAVNLKTAKTMNYNVPAGLLLRADKIIE
jgi:putative ABC transport system substrate-binding protein